MGLCSGYQLLAASVGIIGDPPPPSPTLKVTPLGPIKWTNCILKYNTRAPFHIRVIKHRFGRWQEEGISFPYYSENHLLVQMAAAMSWVEQLARVRPHFKVGSAARNTG